MPNRSLPFTVFVAALLAFAPAQAAKSAAKRRSVLDYYYLLPSIGIGYPLTRADKRELLQKKAHPVIDVPHDYLLVHPDSSPAQQVAVFRARGKADIIAVSLPDFKSDYNAFTLYRLEKGKLRDVTAQTLPVSAHTEKYLYELPRRGTTIRVFQFDLKKGTRRHAFDLKWQAGRFVQTR